jgi:two-component system chemotaxis sensor kinase CheA
MGDQPEMRDEMLGEFIVESGENLNIVEQQLLQLEQEESGPDTINMIFRAMHSVKGASSFLQLKTFETLGHLAESLLDEIREDRIAISSSIIDTLLKCTDTLKEMLQQEDLGEGCDIQVLVDELNEVLGPARCRKPDMGPGFPPRFHPADLDEALKSHDGKSELYAIHIGAENAQCEVKSPEEIKRWYTVQLEGLGNILHTVQVGGSPADEAGVTTLFFETILEEELLRDALLLPKECVLPISVDHKNHTATESTIPGASHDTYAQELCSTPAAQGARENSLHAEARRESGREHDKKAVGPSTPLPVTGAQAQAAPMKAIKQGRLSPGALRPDANSPSNQQTIRIGVNVLDELLELIGEVVLGRNQFLHTYENDASFKNLSQSITKLHQHVIQTRMQPIGNLFEKFQRTVRDLSQKLGKKIELHIEGNEIELDRTIIEALSDPLTHLIRNAVDHGIDSVEERSALGKPTVGNVHLRAYHESGQILIEVEDDGHGIDPERVREKALEKGLITPEEAKRLSEEDILPSCQEEVPT